MNFKNILPIAAIAAMATLTGCDENAWNDKLEGFDSTFKPSQEAAMEYTLTEADYKAIANNPDNKALAEEKGLAPQLSAVGKVFAFPSELNPTDYIPNFFNDPDDSPVFFYSDGSSVKLTYDVQGDLPEEVYAAAAAQTYTVSKADYQGVWESTKNYVESFTPEKPASSYLPAIIKAQFPDAEAGQYVVATFNEAAGEPVFGNSSATSAPARQFAPSRASYTHVKATEVESGKKYVMVAAGNAATTVAEDKGYGYLSVVEAAEDGTGINLADATTSEFTFQAADGGYNIIDCYGRYVYQKDTHNSFNVSTELPETGAVWTVEAQADGTMKILNNEVQKFIQFDQGYTSYGSYSDARGVMPSLYTAAASAPADNDLTNVLGDVLVGDACTVKGVVTAVCAQGYILTDNAGSILVYYGRSYEQLHNVGDVVEISATVGSYNKGLQLTGSTATESIVGTMDVTYPAPVVYSGADLDALLTSRTDDQLAIYAQIQGTVSAGNYINIAVEGATTAQGSIYQASEEQKAMFVDGQDAIITGYFISISSGKFVNFIPTDVEEVIYDGATIESVKTSEIYCFNGSEWSVPEDFVVLTHADYQNMGQKYDNLSGSTPAEFLPIFLKQSYPYAQAEDYKYIVYNYYGSGATSVVCDMYLYNGTEWVPNDCITEETAQYVRNAGKWMYNPNVTITLPAGKNVEISTLYYQACVNWVFENIDKPLGSTDIKSGAYYVTSYGNNEYYCGASAYQGNVDLRAGSARSQYAAGWEAYTDEEVIETMKKRFTEEVLPAVLSELHADAAPVEGLEILYTVNFYYYDSTKTNPAQVVYKVAGPATFEFVEVNWNVEE